MELSLDLSVFVTGGQQAHTNRKRVNGGMVLTVYGAICPDSVTNGAGRSMDPQPGKGERVKGKRAEKWA